MKNPKFLITIIIILLGVIVYLFIKQYQITSALRPYKSDIFYGIEGDKSASDMEA